MISSNSYEDRQEDAPVFWIETIAGLMTGIGIDLEQKIQCNTGGFGSCVLGKHAWNWVE